MSWALGITAIGFFAVIGSVLAILFLPDVANEEDSNYMSDRSCFFMTTCLIGCNFLVFGLVATGIIWLISLL